MALTRWGFYFSIKTEMVNSVFPEFCFRGHSLVPSLGWFWEAAIWTQGLKKNILWFQFPNWPYDFSPYPKVFIVSSKSEI